MNRSKVYRLLVLIIIVVGVLVGCAQSTSNASTGKMVIDTNQSNSGFLEYIGSQDLVNSSGMNMGTIIKFRDKQNDAIIYYCNNRDGNITVLPSSKSSK